MIIDAHAHLGKWYFPIDNVSPLQMTENMKRLGIDRTIVSHSLSLTYDFREGNRLLSKIIRNHPGKIFGYTTVNLNYYEESIGEMKKYLNSNSGFVGVKVHPLLNRRRFDTPEGYKIAEQAALMGIPILIHTFNSDLESPLHAAEVARKVSGVKIILAHMGGFEWLDGIQTALECENLWLEICSTANEPAKIEEAVRAVGAERILFGTDSTLFVPDYSWGMLQDADISGHQRTLIAGLNAGRLFNLTDQYTGV